MNTIIKRFVVGMLVVLVGFVTTGCASGGYLGAAPYSGPLGRVMAGNLTMTCPGDYFIGPPINRCLRDIGMNMGRQYMGYGYPMYYGGMGGLQLSQNDKLSVFCGLGGSGVTMLANAGLGRTLGAGFVSAAACQVAMIAASRRSGNQQAVTSQGSDQRAVRYASDGMPIAIGQPVGASSGGYQPVSTSAPAGVTWNIRNMTGGKGELLNGDRFIKVLEPGESYGVPNPSASYRLVILVPTKQGTLETREAVRQPQRDGWDMIAPVVQ